MPKNHNTNTSNKSTQQKNSSIYVFPLSYKSSVDKQAILRFELNFIVHKSENDETLVNVP